VILAWNHQFKTCEAFGAGITSLGTYGPFDISDGFGNHAVGTAEDSFFGVQDFAGIVEIKLSNISGGIEVDHLQFGSAFVSGGGGGTSVSEPATMLLLGSRLISLVGFRRKFKNKKTKTKLSNDEDRSLICLYPPDRIFSQNHLGDDRTFQF
jgi:hypothetical protein